jgi:large subunit ribosomal protein L6
VWFGERNSENIFIMSRIGKNPIDIPEGVQVTVEGRKVTAKGPKGELQYEVDPIVSVVVEEDKIVCTIDEKVNDVGGRKKKIVSSMWGTMRACLANIVKGVSVGFEKELELHGVGYKATVQGKGLELKVGYSHPVVIEAPEGISFSVDKEIIKVEGIDNWLVGQMAADIRAVRKPEPYKGKGIRYKGEHVRRKVGKVMGTTV